MSNLRHKSLFSISIKFASDLKVDQIAYRKSAVKPLGKRQDFHVQLCKQYDVLVFEDLNLDGMKKLWGRKVSDLGFAKFMKIVQSTAWKQGKRTTGVCSGCGHGQTLTLNEWGVSV